MQTIELISLVLDEVVEPIVVATIELEIRSSLDKTGGRVILG